MGLPVNSIRFSVSLLDDLSSSTKTSGFSTISGPSSLMSILTTFLLFSASFWSSNVTSKRRSFSASLGLLVKPTSFLSLNTTFFVRVSLRVSMSCNRYAVLLLPWPRKTCFCAFGSNFDFSRFRFLTKARHPIFFKCPVFSFPAQNFS